MSISSVGSASSAPANGGNLQVRLDRDQQRLLAATRTKANETQLAADKIAIAKDQAALNHAGRSRVDIKL